jgi:hypothetical protein
MRQRKTSEGLPAYVRAAVDRLEPLLREAKLRTISAGYSCWKLAWHRLPRLDATQICILMDLLDETQLQHVQAETTREYGWVKVWVSKDGRDDDPRRRNAGAAAPQ